MTSNNFCIQCKQSVNNYLEDLWSEIAVSFILSNLRTIKYRLQLTGKASIPEYICIYVSRQSVVKQGFQKTHFPMILKLETFFAIDLVNI